MPAPSEVYLSRDEVRSIDRIAIDDYGLPGIVLMENAGRGAAAVLLARGCSGPVAICCGKGNNGGDGFVIARHLDLAGCVVRLLLTCPVAELTGDARINAEVAQHSGIPLQFVSNPPDSAAIDAHLAGAEWIVDALLGTGTQGTIREPFAAVIEAISRSPARVLAVDLPSGLDADTGQPLGPCVRADLTATFVARKRGFAQLAAAEWLGDVHVIDIGAPRRLLERFGILPAANREA